MIATWKPILWQQFGAAIDMLENALLACPEELWNDRSRRPEYWYVVFHTLFFLDFYLSDSPEGFTPPAPFTLDELDPAGLLPERVYTGQRCGFERPDVTVSELLLYSMRHVQHHAAQLNLMLRQTIDSAPTWVSKTKIKLGGD
ncbi:MAG: DinB family protein [Candidatus Eisenbacteria bacterium]|uniref:DinB family protein n=1 Tax=Eiseniibacteriota bacterium TaxID=2212470 RepID=A0A538TEC2_UNCEI|nr:MAG: DinB family protein [Candidatus Eisenbacteria bacterium]